MNSSSSVYDVPAPPDSCLSVNKLPSHGASRTGRDSIRTDPISPGRRIHGKPLPVRDSVPSHYTSLPSPPFKGTSFPANMVQDPSIFIDNVIKKAEEKILGDLKEKVISEFMNLRTSCSQALLSQQLRADKLQAQSLSYLKERNHSIKERDLLIRECNFAWARVRALEEARNGRGQVGIRRASSLGAIRPARNYSMVARQALSMSPKTSPWLSPHQSRSASPASSGSLAEIKQEEQSILSSSSRSNSAVSSTETLVASPSEDTWTLLYPDSTTTSLKAPSFPKDMSESLTLTTEHMEVVYKRVQPNVLLCRMCIVKRQNLPKEEQRKFHVASFLTDTPECDLHSHCIHAHITESIEIAQLPQSVLQAMVMGFANKIDSEESG